MSQRETGRGLSALILLAGCNAQQIRQQAEEPHGGGAIAAIFPSPGAMDISGELSVQVVLGADGEGQIPAVRISSAEQSFAPACAPDGEDHWIRCEGVQGLDKDVPFSLEVKLPGEEPVFHALSTAFPAVGLAWQLTAAVTVDQFGGNDRLNEKMAEMLANADLIGVLPGTGGSFLVGEGDGSGALTIDDPGLAAALPLAVGGDDLVGAVTAGPADVFLPFMVESERVEVLVQGCVVSGFIEGGVLTGFTLEGEIPAISLVRMVEPLESGADLILSNIAMDADTDGDGAEDAVTLRISGDAAPAELEEWE